MSYSFKKLKPTEEINIGDLIMLDIATGLVTIANIPSVEDYYINANNILGICSETDNTTELPQLLDCGNSGTEDPTTLDLGDSTTETSHVLYCETSEKNSREYIETNNSGIVTLELYDDNDYDDPIEIGDKVIMGLKTNTVMQKEFHDREFIHVRTIGKVVGFEDKKHVKILLDIE